MFTSTSIAIMNASSAPDERPTGACHIRKKPSAAGSAEMYISMCRRPNGERSRSEIQPMSGSVNASTLTLTMIAMPTSTASTPIT